MKVFFSQRYKTVQTSEENLTPPTILDDIEKTRIALEVAYAGFDNATDEDMIDCYIYEINALLKRYKHLSALAAKEPQPAIQTASSPFKTLVARQSAIISLFWLMLAAGTYNISILSFIYLPPFLQIFIAKQMNPHPTFI